MITSTEHLVKREDEEGNVVYQTEPVWNWVVANISLLAVGSSSPEILLALVEACITLGQPAGQIGPACIIGSGAYNLFAITAVITAVLPAGTFKRIEHQKVFIWTTSWSIWAHLWVWLVYKKITPNVIDLWEALVTLAFFPTLVFTAWLVDTRGWRWFGRNKNQVVPSTRGEKEEDQTSLMAPDPDVKNEPPPADEENGLHPKNPSENEDPKGQNLIMESLGNSATDQVEPQPPAPGPEKSAPSVGAPLKPMDYPKGPMGAVTEPKTKKSILYYRHMAVQNVLGGKTKPTEVKESNVETMINMDEVLAMGTTNPKILFKCAEISVLESVGMAKIEVMRMHGDLSSTIHVRYETCDDTALAGLDFEGLEVSCMELHGVAWNCIACTTLPPSSITFVVQTCLSSPSF